MGANAQTSVPTFTAGEVLTAANMNISARTGIPVFADSTARDAAFGGTGEKTLAEGQFAYLESTNATQYYDGSTWQAVASSSGLVCVKAETAVSAAASATADSVFTSTYTNYLLLVNFTTSADQLCIKFRAGGTSTSSGYNTTQILINDTTITSSRVTSQANIRIQQSVGAESSSIIQIFNPQLAIPTRLTQHTALNVSDYTTGSQLNMRASNQSGLTAFDGIELLALTGTWTGNYAIYGYSKAV
tara:strand:+ start:1075 stop:1809 length:735 start_codon:yes stop_codon:yes gene_type:complete